MLCESHLLPGAMIRNECRRFICREQRLRVETDDTTWTCAFVPGEEISIVLKNGEGNYMCDDDTLEALEDNRQVVFRYLDNPNGSRADIAGVTNRSGNVVGLMPHPEHNVDELIGTSLDGRRFFESVLQFLAARV